MKKADLNKTFTALDIQRYHSGELSMQERHALEKAALDDPFLADALEGYTYTTTPQADLAALEQHLSDRTNKNKRGLYIPLFQRPVFRVAAMLLLLAGAGWAVYQFSPVQREELATAKEEKRATQQVTMDTTLTSDTESNTLANEAITLSNTAVDRPKASTRTQQATVSTPHKNTVAATAGGFPAPVAVQEAAVDNTQQAETAPLQTKENRMRMAGSSKDEQALNTFKGQIVDPNGNPVPFANIMVTGKPNAISTNTQGKFLLTTPDSVVNATIAAVGFQSNRLNLVNPEKEQKIVLNEASGNLQEVVVTAYGKKRSRTSSRPSDAKTKTEVEELEPEGGWSGFNDYINQNLHRSEEVNSKQLKGEVELSFEVDKSGEPVNIKVERSLCATCDQEAIRLLKEGPGWKKKKKKAGKVTIRF